MIFGSGRGLFGIRKSNQITMNATIALFRFAYIVLKCYLHI